MHRFCEFLDAIDLFGITRHRPEDELAEDPLDNKPVKGFNLEAMMDILTNKKLGAYEPHQNFINEIQWSGRHGAIKLEVDTGLTFYIKRLGFDLKGNTRWITKKMYQLNRRGFGGFEETVAEEIFDEIRDVNGNAVDSPSADFTNLRGLTMAVCSAIRKSAQPKFLFQKIKQISEHQYQIVFEIDNNGVQAIGQNRIEENITDLSYDRTCGTIKVDNYNVISKVGSREWKLNQTDLSLFFFPSQSPEEIADCVAVHFRYY